MIDKNILVKAEKRSKISMFELANYYYEQGLYDLAYYWMEKSASKKYIPAMYGLSCFYLNGIGTNIDIKKSQKLLYKSAKANYPNAVISLAGLIFNQKIHSKSALKIALKTTKIDRSLGEYYLGLCYFLGFGTKKNIEHARTHFTLSAVLGFDNARFELKNKEFALAV